MPPIVSIMKTRHNSLGEGCVKVMQHFSSCLIISYQVLINYVLTFITSVKWAISDKLLRDRSPFRSNQHKWPVCWYSDKHLEEWTTLICCVTPPSRGRKRSRGWGEGLLAVDDNPVLHYTAERQTVTDCVPEQLSATLLTLRFCCHEQHVWS